MRGPRSLGNRMYGFTCLWTYGGVLYWSTRDPDIWGSMHVGKERALSSSIPQSPEMQMFRGTRLWSYGTTDIWSYRHQYIQD